MSWELFSIIDGVPSDAALHEEILDNPTAEAAIAKKAVQLAVDAGMPRELALSLYGTRNVS